MKNDWIDKIVVAFRLGEGACENISSGVKGRGQAKVKTGSGATHSPRHLKLPLPLVSLHSYSTSVLMFTGSGTFLLPLLGSSVSTMLSSSISGSGVVEAASDVFSSDFCCCSCPTADASNRSHLGKWCRTGKFVTISRLQLVPIQVA